MGTVMKAVLFIGSFFILTAVFAQREIKVSDPDIYFSFLLPEQWKVLDDHYTYYIAPSGDPFEYYMAFTYAGEKSDVEKNKLDETVKFKLDYVYPQNTPGFRLVETGDTHIDGKPAKWIKFHSTVDGARYTNISFIYIKYDMIFTLLGASQAGAFEKAVPVFFEVARSFKTESK